MSADRRRRRAWLQPIPAPGTSAPPRPSLSAPRARRMPGRVLLAPVPAPAPPGVPVVLRPTVLVPRRGAARGLVLLPLRVPATAATPPPPPPPAVSGIFSSAFGAPPFNAVAFGGAATRPPIVSLASYVDPTAFLVLPNDAGGGPVGTATGGTSSAFGVPAFGSVAFGGAREAAISALVSDVDPTAFAVLPNDSAIGEVDPTGFLVIA